MKHIWKFVKVIADIGEIMLGLFWFALVVGLLIAAVIHIIMACFA